MRLHANDTIAAIATAVGEGGIGIVRMSGPDAVAIADTLFVPMSGRPLVQRASHTTAVGTILNPTNGATIDEVLVTVMRAPSTYTREDVVEINCHGSTVALRATLGMVLEAGARAAEPGEFTKRAFLNGRIDLTQAEAVIDVITSRTDAALKAAVSQLEGGLSRLIGAIAERVAGVLTQLEAAVDFSDEDIEVLPIELLSRDIAAARAEAERLLSTAGAGRTLREGVRTAIVGKPNVGKSSLLNALLRQERAIVTEIPGTTRDVIEETISLGGIPLRLQDTAGIRSADNEVERIGVELSRRAIRGAEFVLCVVDGSSGLTQEDRELIAQIDTHALLVINKADLPSVHEARKVMLPGNFTGRVEVSARTGEGIDTLEARIIEDLTGGALELVDTALLTSARHEQLMRSAAAGLAEVQALLAAGQPEEIIATVARDVLADLGAITGETVDEDILGRIFSQFCIGK